NPASSRVVRTKSYLFNKAAIKYQIMVTFMLLSTASLSTIIACYLTYRKFYNSRHQLVVTQLKKK
ncbi:ABC transporter permease, partial [Escherichia coli]|nr:ABC transporter permease [Escherichia coli]